jgi:hypothetical protein
MREIPMGEVEKKINSSKKKKEMTRDERLRKEANVP